jgi:hypothetical protein
MAMKLQDLKNITVFWRSFVYNPEVDNDRLNRAYMEFGPADNPDDGKDVPFLDNVFVQTKNTPLDFQPREPVHPMFGRMPNTNQAVEFQLTMEYLGHAKMATYLGTLFEEFYKWDTYAEGPGTPVGSILDGTAQGQKDTAVVGVNNMGNSDSWTNHHFLQANSYTFGRQAWDWTLTAEDIATEWAKMTWGNDPEVVDTIVEMMMGSREAVVASQSPLGLMHQQSQSGGDHYPPGPWDWSGQDDWGPAYYNKADNIGIGFPRTEQGRIDSLLPVPEPGSGNENYFPLVNQYFPEVRDLFANIETCPEEYLLAFHHVPWDYIMKSGRTLWEELVYLYQMGVQYSTWMIEAWDSLEAKIDARRFSEVAAKLKTQEADQARWRDESLKYFSLVNGLEIPTDTAPLSIKLQVAGEIYGGFDLSHAIDPNSTDYLSDRVESEPVYRDYVINIPLDEYPVIERITAFDPDAEVKIVQQPSRRNGNVAKVKVTKENCFDQYSTGIFGTIVQNYTFQFVMGDTSLKSITIDGKPLTTFEKGKTEYTVYPASRTPVIAAVPTDPDSTAAISQSSAPGTATVTVTSADTSIPQTVYTINYVSVNATDDGFDGAMLDPKWSFVREDAEAWSLDDVSGAMTIKAGLGTLQPPDMWAPSDVPTNSTKNLMLQNAPSGDWTIETKVDLSRPATDIGEQVGLIAYTDDDNYVSIAWRRASDSAGIQTGNYQIRFNVEQAGVCMTFDCGGIDVQRSAGLNEDQIWLRIEKRGNAYIGSFSNNGVNFRPVKFYSAMEFWGMVFVMAGPTAEVPTLNTAPVKVGVFATDDMGPLAADPLQASFAYFGVETKGEFMASDTDKTALDDLYDTWKPVLQAGKVKGNYSDGSWAGFAAAMTDAAAALIDNAISQSEVDDVYDALVSAIANLKTNGQLDLAVRLLESAIGIVVGDEADYTDATWAVYESALDAAKDMVASPDDYTYDELIDGYHVLIAAIQALEYSAAATLKDILAGYVEYAQTEILPDADIYLPVAIANLNDALDAAQAVIDNPAATVAEIQTAIDDLLEAIAQMHEKPDKTALQELVDIVNAANYSEMSYTPETWAALQSALTDATAVLANENATAAQVEEAYEALFDALTGLIPRANFAGLGSVIAQAQNILANRNNYIASTLIGLPTEIDAALVVFNDKNSTQAQINAARTALMLKIAAVRLKPNMSPILNALGIVSSLNLNLFTPQSVEPLAGLVAEAETMLNDSEILSEDDQDRIDALAVQMLKGISALVRMTATADSGNAPAGIANAAGAPAGAGIGNVAANGSVAGSAETPATVSEAPTAVIDQSGTPLAGSESAQNNPYMMTWIVSAVAGAIILVLLALLVRKRRLENK